MINVKMQLDNFICNLNFGFNWIIIVVNVNRSKFFIITFFLFKRIFGKTNLFHCTPESESSLSYIFSI